MRRFVLAAVVLFTLGACGQQPETVAGSAPDQPATAQMAPAPMERATADEEVPASETRAESGEAAAPAQDVTGGASQPTPILYLAYAYAMGFEIPSQNLAGVMDAHVQACQTAGPRLCQLVSSNRSGDPESYVEGYVSLRGEPSWLRAFMAGMEADANAAGGRVISQTTTTEDLTRAIVDTEARLRAQTALRDRLQRLLESRLGRLSDLLEVERELARVQAEIDAVQSNLAVMRTRVSMSELNLSYRSAPRAVGSDTFGPLRDAFANFLKIVVAGFAAIVTIVAGLLPFVLVIWPIAWLLLRWRKARGGRFFRAKPAATDG
ncbi:MAG: DUF4349 domain-containing protein [Hyphomonadaceae bacterium]|nr:DUF4349 domain-containing protein [Hyphomonadaceae bacterium]